MTRPREARPEAGIYKIERLVGHGRTARVYRAYREDSRGHSRIAVALKVLKAETDVSSLRRELDTLTRVNSPHCVRVFGWENLNEGCTLVLEWIDGTSLLSLARRSRLGDELIDEVLAQVQEGLRALNACGLHHGDLSPANILIDRTGCAKLVDFATAPFEPGVAHGTPAYMAPELWRGQPTSAQSDLFALGMIERDLRLEFKDYSDQPAECRARSFSSIGEGLLALEPGDRRPRPLASCETKRSRLAALVEEVMASRPPSRIETAILAAPVEPRWRPRPLAASMVAIFTLTTMAVEARAPRASTSPGSSIAIRAHHWLEATLNGRALGYAPIDVRGLPPGRYKLAWKTAREAGERFVELKPGAELRLSEADLVGSLR